MATADIGNQRPLLELGLDAVQDGIQDEVRFGGVAGAEEALGAAEQVVEVLVPAHAPRPLRNASAIRSASLVSAVATWNAPGTNAGLPSGANASDYSGERKNASRSGSVDIFG